MILTEQEKLLIEKIRKAQQDNPYEELVFLLRYIPTDFEGAFIQQVLPGQPQSVLQMRLATKRLLDDLAALQLPNTFFSITYEPYAIRLFKH